MKLLHCRSKSHVSRWSREPEGVAPVAVEWATNFRRSWMPRFKSFPWKHRPWRPRSLSF